MGDYLQKRAADETDVINKSTQVLSSTSLPCLFVNKDRDLLRPANQSQSQCFVTASELTVKPDLTPPLCDVCYSKNCTCCSSECPTFDKAQLLLANSNYSSCSEIEVGWMDKAQCLCLPKEPLILTKSGNYVISSNYDSVSLLSNVAPIASVESMFSEQHQASENLSLIVNLSENQQEVQSFCDNACHSAGRNGTKATARNTQLAENGTRMCRICHSGEEDEELIAACRCAGTVKYAHQSCLLNWISKSGNQSCELCRYKFKTRRRKVRYFWKWQFPEVSTKGYLHIGLFIAFITMLLTSVVWIIWSRVSGTPSAVSERTTEEVKFAYMLNGLFIALALGGLYFDSLRHMKRYFKRWSMLNRHVIIEDYAVENDKTHQQHLNREISRISMGIEATENDATSCATTSVGTWV